jgi:hypothetical protein
MRLCLLFALLCLSTAWAGAQSTNFNLNFQPSFHNRISDLRTGPNGELFLTNNGDESPGIVDVGMIRVNPDGTGQAKTFFFNATPVYYDVMPAADGGYLVLIRSIPCDVGTEYPELYYIDSTGTLQNNLLTDITGPAKMLPAPDHTVWVFGTTGPPVKYSYDGIALESGPYNLPVFKGYVQLPGHNLTYGPSGIALYNETFSAIQTGLQGVNVLKADTLSGHRYVAMTHDSLYLLDQDFAVLKSVAHNVPDGQLADMDTYESQIWVLTQGIGASILAFDDDLNPGATLAIPADGRFEPHFINRNGNRLVLAGEEAGPAYLPDHQVSAVHAMPADAPVFTTSADAGVVGINMPHNPSGANFAWPSPGYQIAFSNVSVTVRNFGTGFLERVTLNAPLTGYYYWCGYEEYDYLHTFENLHLAPGDSVNVPIGDLVWSQPDAVLPPTFDLCFWTTLPNDSLDHGPANNRYCHTYSITTGANEPKGVGPVSVKPNPATGQCTVAIPDLSGEIISYRLIDVTGHIVREIQQQGQPLVIDREGLPPGLYAIWAQTASGKQFCGRVVFQ